MISAPRLAWLQLRRERVRFGVALAGVAFAVLLMLMQLGFQDALFDSACNVHRTLNADIVLLHPFYLSIVFPKTFARVRVHQARAVEGVAWTGELYTSIARFKDPAAGGTRDIFLVGIDPSDDLFDVPGIRDKRATLRYTDRALFDARARPEFGPVAELVRRSGEVVTEVNGHDLHLRDLFEMGTSFGIDGTIVVSDLTFLAVHPERSPSAVSIGLVRTIPGADPRRVRDAIAAALPPDVHVLTRDEYMEREVTYWASATPIGYVFTFGVVMGLVVGCVIVYQILFADVSEHLPEYATVKAMGYPNRYLSGVVVSEALILAVLGYLPGLAVSWWLYGVTETATKLPMTLTLDRGAQVLGLAAAMCTASALLAARRLRAADPADVF
jgi:putative ABC transport system permease protein